MEKKVVIRPATKADILQLRGRPYKESFRGFTAELDGEVLGVCGVLHTPTLQAFMTIKDVMKQHPRAIVLAIKKFRKLLNTYEQNVYVLASPSESTSIGFVKHIGFNHYRGRVYQWLIQ